MSVGSDPIVSVGSDPHSVCMGSDLMSVWVLTLIVSVGSDPQSVCVGSDPHSVCWF